MEEGEADLEPGWDCDTPPGPRDLGLPDLSGVPVGSPPPGPSWSEPFLGRAEIRSILRHLRHTERGHTNEKCYVTHGSHPASLTILLSD